ncbi:MAG: hypothetical protein WC915_01815 [archaeon]|jgi:hypothetical protein
MGLGQIYSNLEDKWYSTLDKLDSKIPVYKIIDPIDKIIPSFILFIALIIILVLFLTTQLLFVNSQNGQEFEVVVLNNNNLPLKDARVIVFSGCAENEISLLTNEDGKITTPVCGDEIEVSAKKTGYEEKGGIFLSSEKAVLKLALPIVEDRYVTIFVEDTEIILGAEIEVICDNETQKYLNQTTDGFFVSIPPQCGFVQIKAKSSGYEEKTITLEKTDERKTINLVTLSTKGTVTFVAELNNVLSQGVEISLTNSIGQTQNYITNDFGEIKVELEEGTYTYIANKDGEFKDGEFTVFAKEKINVPISLVSTQVSTKKYIALELVNSTNQAITLAQIELYRDGVNFGSKTTNTEGKTDSPKYISDSVENSNYFAIITAQGFGVNVIPLTLIETGYQKVILQENNSSLKVNVFNDQNQIEVGAIVGIKFSGIDSIINLKTTDANGSITLNNLPIGQVTIQAYDKSKNDEIEKTLNVARNEQKETNIYLNTGKGKIQYSFFNHEYDTVDVNLAFDYNNVEIMKKSYRQKFLSDELKNNSNVYLKVTDSNYYPLLDFEYLIKRGITEKDVFVRKLGELPNNNEIQMFLKRVYKANPKYASVGTNTSVTKLLPGQEYYFLFETILTSENENTLLNNFIIGDKTKETLTTDENASIYGIYGPVSSREILTSKNTGNVIDLVNTEFLVENNAKQANTLIDNATISSIPTILKIKIDENAQGKVIINFNALHGEIKSIDYVKEITIGESFCIDNCPNFFFDNYLIKNNVETIIDDKTDVFIEDEYKLKTIVRNVSDKDFGIVSFVNSIPLTKQRYILMNDDKNIVSKDISLSPVGQSTTQIVDLKLKTLGTATIFQRIEKITNGIDTLSNTPGNNQSISLQIKNKKNLAIDVSSKNIDEGAYYPLKTIRTRYTTSTSGISAHWFAEVNSIQIMSGTTDENGLSLISFDASGLYAGDNVKFTVYDDLDSVKGYFEINVNNPFKLEEEPDECLKVELNNTPYIPNHTTQTLNVGETTTLKLKSDCDIERIVKLHTDLGLSELTTIIPAKNTKTITLTATPRGNLLGVYPVQVFTNNGSVAKQIAQVDIIVKDPSSCFDLEQAIFDMRTTGKLSSKVTNKCLAGRKDNFYPQLNLATSSVSLDYKKPGLPRDMNISINVRGSAIESTVNGTVKSEGIYVESDCDAGWFGSKNTRYYSQIPNNIFTEDAIEDICKDLQREYEPNPKPEPDRNSPQTIQKEYWVPSQLVNSSDVKITAKGQTQQKISFALTDSASTVNDDKTKVTQNYLKNYSPKLGDSGSWLISYMPLQGMKKGINTAPSKYNSATIEFFWDKWHDHKGNITEKSGGESPKGFSDIFGAKGQLYVNGDPMWQYARYANINDVKQIYYDVYSLQADGKGPFIYYAGSPAEGAEEALYYRVYAESDDCGSLIHNPNDSKIGMQIDSIGITEFLVEQRAMTTVSATIQPIEGKVYKLGSYRDATPLPQFDIKELGDGYETGDSYTIDQSRMQVTCIINNGFVDPSYATTVGHQGADSFNGMPIRISPPSAALDSVEYSSDGYVWYYVWPFEYDSKNLRVYLENGSVYAEYIGVAEIESNNIDFNITKNNLLGNEYAVIEVSDWVGNTKETKAFQIKLIGNENECFSTTGVEGITGREFQPRLSYDWSWENISSDQCNSDNSSYTFCDGTQFTISLFKKLKIINDYLIEGKTQLIPQKTAFYAYLIKDSYNNNFLNDFVTYYSNNLTQSNPEFINKYFNLITQNKLSFNANMNYGGLYRVEIDINNIEHITSLFDGTNPSTNIKITLKPIYKANNYNLLYEMPFDGSVGIDTRNGYGVSFNKNVNINPNLEVSTSNTSTKYITVQDSSNLDVLNRGIVFNLENNSLILTPSQPNPITIPITSNNGIASIGYNVVGEFSDTLTHKTWQMISSTIGGKKCNDFEGKEGLNFDIQKNNSGDFTYNWKGTRDGKITLGTTILTPASMGGTPLKITPKTNTTLNGYAYLKNNTSSMLNNYENENINFNSLKDMLGMITQEQMCISRSENNLQIFWNPAYLLELINEVNTSGGSKCY